MPIQNSNFYKKNTSNETEFRARNFSSQPPKKEKNYFFRIISAIILILAIFLVYKSFAKPNIGTANNISLDYDTNSVKFENGKLQCIEDDRIFQWHKGENKWECEKPTSSVFGELDKNNIKVNDSGNLECKENGKVLYWDKDQWACGDAGNTNFILTENGLELDKNKLSIDSPTCSGTDKLQWNGSKFICSSDKDEDKQILSFLNNKLSIENGNDVDLSNLSHNILADLQGGKSDEYYHLNEEEHNNLTDFSNVFDLPNSDGNNNQVLSTDGSGNLTWKDDNNTTNHSSLTGLTNDDHTQYALLNGRAGGQTLIGGTNSGDNLTLQSTSNATKGKINFGNSVYDEVNNRLGLGTTTPSKQLQLTGNIEIPNTTFSNQNGVIYKNGVPFIHNFNYGNNGTVTTNGRNLFIGENAGNFTTGSTATNASESSYNIGIGTDVLRYVTKGNRNTGIGYIALQGITTGSQNTTLGHRAGYGISTATSNTYIGADAGIFATGSSNCVVGAEAHLTALVVALKIQYLELML